MTESGFDSFTTFHGMKCPLEESITAELSIVFPALFVWPLGFKALL